MKFLRYQDKTGISSYGWLQDDKVGPIEGIPLGEYRRLDAVIPLTSLRLLPPLLPGKIICVGRNYVAHAREHGADVPEVPLIFLKPQSSIIGQGDPIILPPQSTQVEHEAELSVVIGKRGRWIKTEDAQDHIFGYTIGNDITARDLQRRDGQWTRSKSFDTFCPLGPWIDTAFDPADTIITCHVNGELRQMGSTRDMVFGVNQLIAFVSSVMTLDPGDIILTGTPSGVSPVHPGDLIEVTIEGLGTLRNTVIEETLH
ncbi:MAG TPA: fumarylacetoacetate hydrolase family protein [Anaerolineales bacterium]|nr:fumarylacetoacetate hydrolase family protein [Anaerolineales bacterium]